jgi:hypothetical protein
MESFLILMPFYFKNLLKPAAGRLPNRRDDQNFSGAMISTSGTLKTSAGRRFSPE